MTGEIYERVAEEYYDADLHPTCANLRTASDHGLGLIAERLARPGRRLLEIGAGSSALTGRPELADQPITCIDLNYGMLASTSGSRVRANALRMPFGDGCFHAVYGSLVDPFNSVELHRECRRACTPSGLYAFTVPDVDWVRHNQSSIGLPRHTAGFTLATGETVLLPSRVLAFERQVAELHEAGFATVEVLRIPSSTIPRQQLSPRFLREDGQAVGHIVTLYVSSPVGVCTG